MSIMKKLVTSLIVSFLLLVPIKHSSFAAEGKDSKRIVVQSVGITEHTTIESTVKDDGSVLNKETRGVEAIGNFTVTPKSFKGTINDRVSGKTYNLHGVVKVVNSKEEGYQFQGTDIKNKKIKFNAIVTKNKLSNRYDADISVYEFKNISDKEPSVVTSFTFNGKKPQTYTYREKTTISIPKSEPRKGMVSTASLYYETRSTGHAFGINTLIQGPYHVRRGASADYRVRHTTNSSQIIKYWRDQGYVINQKPRVISYKTNYYTSSNGIFHAVDPVDSNAKQWTVPVYLGPLGVKPIPVKVSSNTVSGRGSNSLKYAFSWSSWSGYLDDSKVTSAKPKNKGYATVAEYVTNAKIPLGAVSLSETGSFKYYTHVYKYPYNPSWRSKSVNHKVTFKIKVIN